MPTPACIAQLPAGTKEPSGSIPTHQTTNRLLWETQQEEPPNVPIKFRRHGISVRELLICDRSPTAESRRGRPAAALAYIVRDRPAHSPPGAPWGRHRTAGRANEGDADPGLIPYQIRTGCCREIARCCRE